MKLGFSLFLGDNEKQLLAFGDKLLGEGSFCWLELRYPYNIYGFDPRDYLQAASTLISRYLPGVSVHIPPSLDVASENSGMRREAMRQIKQCIDFAHSLGATVMPIHPGTIGLIDIPPDRCMNPDLWALIDRKKEQAKRATIEALQEAGDYAASCHITLALENVLHSQEILHSPQQMLEILDAVDLDNVKGLVDVGHANRVGLNPADFIRRLGDKLCHVHLSDNDGTCDLHLPLGDGTIDFHSVLVQLAAMDYQDAVIIEIVGDKESDFLQSEMIVRSVIE